MKLTKNVFGKVENKTVNLYTIKNSNSIEISFLDYGCIITKLLTPDKNGNIENIVLGYDTLEEYLTDDKFLGVVCGRVAGRIKGANFELDGKVYNVTKNHGDNHLHGGEKHFGNVVWDSKSHEDTNEAYVTFSYVSEDGEEGYPGTLNAEITYLLNEDNELIITYKATTDKKTIINMTNHSYFNLSGDFKDDVLQHNIKIGSDKFVELGEDSIPTGEFIEVTNNPFDLRNGKIIKDVIEAVPSGIDHPFLLDSNSDIILSEEKSGRTLAVETDQKSVVVYTSNNMPPELKHIAICLETQGLPDAINHKNFPQITLDVNETYNAKTKYIFGV